MSVEAPANFLDLCKRLRLEAGISGTGPTTVVSQTGENQRIVAWVNTAWNYIQTLHQDWEWMRNSVSFVTVTGQPRYTIVQTGLTVATFGRWIRESFRNHDTAQGTASEIFMGYLDYEVWRDTFEYSALRDVETRPTIMTITPEKSIGLAPFPISGYTVIGDYYAAPTILAADTDIPTMPAPFFMSIVYKAMMYYGRYEAATEVYQGGETEFKKVLKQLEADRIPHMMFSGALA